MKEFETLRPSDVMGMLRYLDIKFNLVVVPFLSSSVVPLAD